MRKLLVVLAAAVVLQGSSLALAQSANSLGQRLQRSSRPSKDDVRRARINKIMRILDKSVAQVNWEDEAIEDLYEDFFKGEHGLKNLVFKWKTIENSGANVDPSSTVTLALADTTVGELLDLALEQLSAEADTDSDRLTYHIIGGMIKVSTRADFDRVLYTKAYSVEHLYMSRPFWVDAPEIRVDQAGGGGQGGGQGGGGGGQGGGGGGQGGGSQGGGSIFGGSGGGGGGGSGGGGGGAGGGAGGGQGGLVDFEQEREDRQTDLTDLLKQVRPETWDDGNGPGTITAFGDKLVITQTLEMHEIIGGRFAYTRDFNP